MRAMMMVLMIRTVTIIINITIITMIRGRGDGKDRWYSCQPLQITNRVAKKEGKLFFETGYHTAPEMQQSTHETSFWQLQFQET